MYGIIDYWLSTALRNELIESISVVLDGELSIIVNLDPDGIRHTDFFGSIMKLSHIWMVQSLLHCDPLLRAETQQSPQQIHSLRGCFGEETSESDALLVVNV